MGGGDKRLLTTLLVLCAVFFALAVAAGAGWYWSARGERVSLESLSTEDRVALMETLRREHPGVFQSATYEPAMGYTFARETRVEAYGDTFVTNALGFRAGPVEKPADTFRVVFVGDSWTYGLGVSEAESFPRQFEAVANRMLGDGHPRVEAWTLAMPGYNTQNEVAALEFFFDGIEPDAVVFGPMGNDMNSSFQISPQGRLTRSWVEPEFFADGQSLRFPRRRFDSHVFRSRWRTAFGAIRDLHERVRARDVPFLLYFVATWDEPMPHWLVEESGIEAPYAVTPPELTTREWYNPPPFGHANPEANRLYGRIVYRALGELLDWPALAREEGEPPAPLWRAPPEPPAPRNWAGWAGSLLRQATEARIPEGYVPEPQREIQCIGLMDCASGVMGRTTGVLVRRREGAERLAITVAPLPGASLLYPLDLEARIPAPGGGTRARTRVPGDAAGGHRLMLDIPPEVPAGAALDVLLRAAGTVSAPEARWGRSLRIERIEQRP